MCPALPETALPRPAAADPAHAFVALDACHRQVQEQLAALRAMLKRLDSHGLDRTVRETAGAAVRFFDSQARQHHQDEERVVFPPLLNSGSPELAQHVRRLQQDHGWLEENWLELQPLLAAIADGHGWVDLDLLRSVVEVFDALYEDHIALEESLVYPQARALMARALQGRGRRLAAQRAADRDAD